MRPGIPDDRPIRWGIISAGRIATSVASDIAMTPGNEVAVVGARDLDRAWALADNYAGARAVAGYPAVVEAPEVDVVYVATTHPGHRDAALLAIEAGKAVLVEKPLCLNAADTRAVFQAADRAGVFAMEAMWMRTNPLIRKAEELIHDGAIGAVRGVRAEFGIALPYDPTHRLFDLGNGGGALLDLGIYPVTFAYLFLGKPDRVVASGRLAPTGADESMGLMLSYADSSTAQLWCSASAAAPNSATIYGSKGWIATEGQAHRPSGLIVHTADGEYRIPDPIEDEGHGYGPEIAEVARCLRAGLTESPLIPHADTIAIMELMDDARRQVGVRYPGE